MKYVFILLGMISLSACKEKSIVPSTPKTQETVVPKKMDSTEIAPSTALPPLKDFGSLADTTFVRLADYSHDFVYDMRYATKNNFLKEKVYECAECYIRAKTAKALIKANTAFLEKGYRIKFFDCYRPNSVQHKMWELFPNPQYVADPVKGSIHNKGGAVDVTLVDLQGNELDMGTDFDFFGKEAHHDHMDLPQEVLNNRKLLKETLEDYGFWGIRTEWWHYNLSGASKQKIADFRWECK